MDVENKGKTLFCKGEKKHCFDFSSKGYVNLAGSRGVTGDSKQAVRSRTDFLNKGYYAPIADKLCDILGKYLSNGTVLDAGCGEGYYTYRISDVGYETVGLDLSKYAVDSVASRLHCKTNEDALAVVASIYDMPFCDGFADAAVSIFAPCAEDEISRVLSDSGILVIVSAGREHLMGLKKVLYQTAYENEERADMPKGMKMVMRESLKYSIKLEDNADIKNLFSMTPYYWRTSPSDCEKLEGLDTLETVVDINFFIYKKDTDEENKNV
jgi:23S rRNA (guanine745-N1)-methyltransferase